MTIFKTLNNNLDIWRVLASERTYYNCVTMRIIIMLC